MNFKKPVPLLNPMSVHTHTTVENEYDDKTLTIWWLEDEKSELESIQRLRRKESLMLLEDEFITDEAVWEKNPESVWSAMPKKIILNQINSYFVKQLVPFSARNSEVKNSEQPAPRTTNYIQYI